MKFNVGDYVKIKEGLTEEGTGICKEKLIEIYQNNKGIIVEIDCDNVILVKLDEFTEWYFDEDELELLERGDNKMKIRGFEVVGDNFRKNKSVDITLPTRGSKYSAGYDFYSPIDIEIQPHSKVCVWSDIKAYMRENEVLMLYVRSSIGIKRGLRLSNGTGIIDKDYYSNPDNDGNIGISLHNYTDEIVKISKGERICQGIFIPFLVADDGNSDNDRTGGIGSTGTK